RVRTRRHRLRAVPLTPRADHLSRKDQSMSRYHLGGRTVAITGSTGGLGSAVATALRDRGANVVLLDRDPVALAAQSEVLGGPSVALPITVDVQDLASLETAMLEATDHFGRLDVVIA